MSLTLEVKDQLPPAQAPEAGQLACVRGRIWVVADVERDSQASLDGGTSDQIRLLVKELPCRPDLELALAICMALLDREPATYPGRSEVGQQVRVGAEPPARRRSTGAGWRSCPATAAGPAPRR